MRRLVYKATDDSPPVFYELVTEWTVIGGSPANEVIVDLPLMAGRHAVVKWRGDGACIDHLGSAHPVIVNDVRFRGPEDEDLAHGDVIRFGGATFVYLEEVDPEADRMFRAYFTGETPREVMADWCEERGFWFPRDPDAFGGRYGIR